MTVLPRLPGILAKIADVAGIDAALEVARARGGTDAYFPARPGASHWLTQAVGREAAIAICRVLVSGKGDKLLVPMGPTSSQAARWRRIHEMIDEGHSTRTVARAVGVDYSTVKRHKRGAVKTASATVAQGDLFDG